MKAHWTDASHQAISAPLASTEELRAVIAEVRALSEPTMLFVELDGGETLMVGLGNPQSVLSYVDAEGIHFHSVGDLASIGAIQFWCRDQLDDFFADMAVPEATAIEAALSFAENGRRPANVNWQTDW